MQAMDNMQRGLVGWRVGQQQAWLGKCQAGQPGILPGVECEGHAALVTNACWAHVQTARANARADSTDGPIACNIGDGKTRVKTNNAEGTGLPMSWD